MNQSVITQERRATRQMLPELSVRHQSIEKRKAELLVYLDGLTDAERNKTPTPTEWSPLQALEHLILLEEMSLDAELPAHAKILLKGHLFMGLGGGMTRIGAATGLRLPTLPAFEPPTHGDFAALKRRWDNTRNALSPKLAAVTRASAPFVMHAVAGPLSAKQYLELLDVHLAYHWRHFPRFR